MSLNMKYSGRHDGKALEIYRDLEDDEILKDTDAEATSAAATPEVEARDDLERKRDKINTNVETEGNTYREQQPSLGFHH